MAVWSLVVAVDSFSGVCLCYITVVRIMARLTNTSSRHLRITARRVNAAHRPWRRTPGLPPVEVSLLAGHLQPHIDSLRKHKIHTERKIGKCERKRRRAPALLYRCFGRTLKRYLTLRSLFLDSASQPLYNSWCKNRPAGLFNTSWL